MTAAPDTNEVVHVDAVTNRRRRLAAVADFSGVSIAELIRRVDASAFAAIEAVVAEHLRERGEALKHARESLGP